MKGYLIFMIDKTNFTKGSQDTFFAGTLEEASETLDSGESGRKMKRNNMCTLFCHKFKI